MDAGHVAGQELRLSDGQKSVAEALHVNMTCRKSEVTSRLGENQRDYRQETHHQA